MLTLLSALPETEKICGTISGGGISGRNRRVDGGGGNSGRGAGSHPGKNGERGGLARTGDKVGAGVNLGYIRARV